MYPEREINMVRQRAAMLLETNRKEYQDGELDLETLLDKLGLKQEFEQDFFVPHQWREVRAKEINNKWQQLGFIVPIAEIESCL